MATVTQHTTGTFCWPELATTDQEGAKKFYTALFGWTANDTPIGEGETYTMLQKGGKEVGALYKMRPEQTSMGIPTHWDSYVSVESADQAAQKAKQLGGQVIVEPFDVMEHGRMAVMQDPTGATFCVWQPKQHRGASLLNETGALCWNELITTDTATAGKFYKSLFGWTGDEKHMNNVMYTVFQNGEIQAAGMMKRTPEMGDTPPHWMVYFAVDDTDKSAAKTKELGGKVHVPPMDIPNIGRFAVLEDPQGGFFSIIKMFPSPA